MMCLMKSRFPFFDTPWDLLVICYESVNANLILGLSYTLGIMSAYFLPIFSICGIVFNIHIIYIFMFKFPHKTRQFVYLSCLASADILNLIFSSILQMFLSKGLPFASNGKFYLFILGYGQIACVGCRMINLFCVTGAINILILTSIDRCLSIYFPFKFIRMTVKTAWILVLVTCLITFAEVLPVVLLMKGYVVSDQKKAQCTMTPVNPTLGVIMQIYRLLFCYCGLIQVAVVCVVNLLLLYKILKADNLRKEIRSVTTNSSKEIAACTLLLLLSLLFTIITIPRVVMSHLAYFVTNEDALKIIYNVNDIFWLLFLYNESINWLVYFIRMQNFRNYVLKSLGCFASKYIQEPTETRVTDIPLKSN